jgi:hypothetical protein
MTDKPWKRTEREVARRLGGRRVPVSGRQRGDAPDVEHSDLSIEVKHRESLPGWLHDAMAQARAASGPGQVPVAILHQRGMRYDQSLVVVELRSLSGLLATITGKSASGTARAVAVHESGKI